VKINYLQTSKMKTDDQRDKKSVKIKIGLLRRKKRIFC